MTINEILKRCDHTLLAQTATSEDIKRLCDEGIKYRTASVCIPPCYVRFAKEYVRNRLKICTVTGFPNGYNDTSVKLFETHKALDNGADEIETVINIGKLKEHDYGFVEKEIRLLKNACGDRILKVIIETCLLTEEEKITMCKIVTSSGADYIKTSTGFSTGGATAEDIELMKAHVGQGVKIKAAGGIRTLADAEDLIFKGADRLGTSRIVKLAIEAERN